MRSAVTGRERGYVLFHCEWETAPAPAGEAVEELARWRDRLYREGLVGVYPDGIGFGNLSRRTTGDAFLVSGTGTGRLHALRAEHFTEVVSCDFAANRLRCRGPVQASSESLSHAAVYRADREAGAVVHVHHAALWERLHGRAPTTGPQAQAGTPAMAWAIQALLREEAARRAGLLVMGGHPEGLLAWGRTLDEAGERVLEAYGRLPAEPVSAPPGAPG